MVRCRIWNNELSIPLVMSPKFIHGYVYGGVLKSEALSLKE